MKKILLLLVVAWAGTISAGMAQTSTVALSGLKVSPVMTVESSKVTRINIEFRVSDPARLKQIDVVYEGEAGEFYAATFFAEMVSGKPALRLSDGVVNFSGQSISFLHDLNNSSLMGVRKAILIGWDVQGQSTNVVEYKR